MCILVSGVEVSVTAVGTAFKGLGLLGPAPGVRICISGVAAGKYQAR